MQYNSDSDSQDIVSLIGDATGINTTANIKQITRAANRAGKLIWSWIFSSRDGWQYDDSNNSNLPSSTAALVANQQQYTLPSEALTVRSLEYKDEGGTWNKITELSIPEIQQKISEKEWQDTPSEPRYYSLVSGIIKLYPAADFSQSASLRIGFDRGSLSFASTDTTKTPGFASEFHEAIADGASYFIARDKKKANWQLLEKDWMTWEEKIKNFYKERWVDKFPEKIKVGDYTQQLL